MSENSTKRSIVLIVVIINTIISILLAAGVVVCVQKVLQFNYELGKIHHNAQVKKEYHEKGTSPLTYDYESFGKCCVSDGRRGERGRKGKKGDQGDIGAKGINGGRGPLQPLRKDNEFIHLIGEGKSINFTRKAFLMTWKVQERSSNMNYTNGFIKIPTTGYYYIYSQLYYFDRCLSMNHVMYIDDRVVLETLRQFGHLNISNSHQTMHLGGIFKIEKNQKLYITLEDQVMYFDKHVSHFGAFLVHY